MQPTLKTHIKKLRDAAQAVTEAAAAAKEAVRLSKLRQKDVASKMEISQAYLSDLLNLNRLWSADLLSRLGKALETSTTRPRRK